MDYHALGKRIRAERLNQKLTQEKLAEDVNVSPTYIGQIERGERSLTLEKLVLIVNRLGVTVDYMLSESVPPQEDTLNKTWNQLLLNKSDKEKMLAINMIKLLFNYLDEKK